MRLDPAILVIVTGATGFVGRQVTKILAERCIPYVAVGRSAKLSEFPGCNKVLASDLLMPKAAQTIAQLGGTHLIHLAWYAEHQRYWTSSKNFEWAEATLSLVQAFAASGRHVTFVGTCAEYDWAYGLLNEQRTPLQPSTLYGQVKASTGSLTRAICRAADVSCCWARLFFPFGPGEHPDRFVPAVIDSILGLRSPFSIGNDSWRDFLAVQDAADAIVSLTLSGQDDVFNICSGIPRRIGDIVKEIGSAIGVAAPAFPEAKMTSGADYRWIIGDDSKLRATGWKPKRNFSERLVNYAELRRQLSK